MKANIIIFAAILFLSLPSSLFSQDIKVGKLEARNDLLAPVTGDELDKKAKSDNVKWVAFYAHYDIAFKGAKKNLLDDGQWLNDIEVNWELLYKPEDAADKIQNYLRMTKKVKYTDIGKGSHTAVILIHPTKLKRYFLEGKSAFMRALKLKFTMKVNGKTLQSATKYFEGGREAKTPKYAKIFGHEDTYELKNIILNRMETPFIHTQPEYFDTIVDDKN